MLRDVTGHTEAAAEDVVLPSSPPWRRVHGGGGGLLARHDGRRGQTCGEETEGTSASDTAGVREEGVCVRV